MAAPFTVLSVCMGNICRSPMAERLLVAAAREVAGAKADALLYVHGGGVGDWHIGERMDPGAARQVRARGGDTDGFRARKLRGEHIDSSDLVLTATADHQDYVLSLRPDAASRTFVLGEFGRLLPAALSSVDLPAPALDPDERRLADPAQVPDRDAVYERGVAIVEAVGALRGGQPPRPDDDLDDPWGRDDRYFGRVADEIETTVRPFVAALLRPVSPTQRP
jgi:protein-tyrosine phosphatase